MSGFVHKLTEADIALLEMASTRGALYDDYRCDEEEDVD